MTIEDTLGKTFKIDQYLFPKNNIFCITWRYQDSELTKNLGLHFHILILKIQANCLDVGVLLLVNNKFEFFLKAQANVFKQEIN